MCPLTRRESGQISMESLHIGQGFSPYCRELVDYGRNFADRIAKTGRTQTSRPFRINFAAIHQCVPVNRSRLLFEIQPARQPSTEISRLFQIKGAHTRIRAVSRRANLMRQMTQIALRCADRRETPVPPEETCLDSSESRIGAEFGFSIAFHDVTKDRTFLESH